MEAVQQHSYDASQVQVLGIDAGGTKTDTFFVRAAAYCIQTAARYCGDRTANSSCSAAASQPPHSEAAITGRAV
jgi:hypothetical protein